MESDANLPSLEDSASVRIIPRVTQGSDQAVVEDAEDVEEGQEQVMGDVLDSTAVGRPRRTQGNQVGSLQIWSWLMHFRSLRRLFRPPSEKLRSVLNRRSGKKP